MQFRFFDLSKDETIDVAVGPGFVFDLRYGDGTWNRLECPMAFKGSALFDPAVQDIFFGTG